MSDEGKAVSKAEEKASRMGWVPQEEWKGPDDKWKTAEDFLKHGEEINSVLKERLDKLQQDMETTIKLNKAEVERARKESYDRAAKEYAEKLETLKKKKLEAVQEGDIEEYVKIEGEEAKLKPPDEPKKEEPPSGEQQFSPVFIEWKSKNKWYGEDQEMSDFAEYVAAKINGSGEKLPEVDFFREVEKRVKSTFPGKFQNENREKPGAVEGGEKTSGSPGRKRTFADLPDSAKATFNRLKKQFERQGRELKKEDYVNTYFEDEE